MTCKHKWENTEYTTPSIASERICTECGLKQKISYLGGGMWKWKSLRRKKVK